MWENYEDNRPQVAKDLMEARAMGMDFLRTFVQFDLVTVSCNGTILSRVADFITMAGENGIQTVLALDARPNPSSSALELGSDRNRTCGCSISSMSLTAGPIGRAVAVT